MIFMSLLVSVSFVARRSRHEILRLALVVAMFASGLTAVPQLRRRPTTSSSRAARSSTAPAIPWFYADVGDQGGRIAAVGRARHRDGDDGRSTPPARSSRPASSTCTRTATAASRRWSCGTPEHGRAGHHARRRQSGRPIAALADSRSEGALREAGHRHERGADGRARHACARASWAQRDNQLATDADIQAMQKLVDEGMADGAFGLSTRPRVRPGPVLRNARGRRAHAHGEAVRRLLHQPRAQRRRRPDVEGEVGSDAVREPARSGERDDHDRPRDGRARRRVAPQSEGRELLGIEPGGDAADPRSARAGARGLRRSVSVRDVGHGRQHGADSRLGALGRRARRQAISSKRGGGGGRGGRGGGGPAIKERFKKRLGNDDDVRKIRMDIAHEIDRRGGASADHHQRLSGSEVRQQVAAVRRRRSEDVAARRRDLAAAERRRPRRRREHARLLALRNRSRPHHAAGLHGDLHGRRHRRARPGPAARAVLRHDGAQDPPLRRSTAASSRCRSRFGR